MVLSQEKMEWLTTAVHSLGYTGKFVDPSGNLTNEDCKIIAKTLGRNLYRWDSPDEVDRCFRYEIVMDKYLDYITEYLDGIEGEEDKEKPMSLYEYANSYWHKIEC